MPPQEADLNINFAQGLDTKTDPWQLSPGKFLSLVNMVFTTGDLLSKRNGYGLLLGDAPPSTYLTTLSGNLLAVGETISAYSQSNQSWITKGSLQPASLSVIPLVRNNLNQTQSDSAVASNGLVCTVYTQSDGVSNIYRYVIADSITGQNIVSPTNISADSAFGTPKVFALGNYFVIVYTTKVSSAYHLTYIAVSISNPTSVTSPADITTHYVPSSTVAFDGAVFSNALFLAWNGDSSTEVRMAWISSILAVSANVIVDASHGATLMSVAEDAKNGTIWATYFDSSTDNAYTLAVSTLLGSILSPTSIFVSTAAANLATVADSGLMTLFYEVTSAYSYDSGVPSNFIRTVTMTQLGVSGANTVSIRSVGLASKAFIIDGSVYYLSAYSSTFQPSYFLVNGSTSSSASPVIVAKVAYQNGGGYLTTGLPSVSVSGSIGRVSYLFKQDVEALNTLNTTQQTTAGGIYSQLGINLVSFEVGTQNIDSAEIGNDLHLSGGFLGMFDGFYPVEHNFFLFPDNVELSYTESSTVTPTGTVATGSNIITAVSSVSGIFPGMTITGTAIPSNTSIVHVGTTTLTISSAATGNHSSETLTIQGNIAAVPTGSAGAGSGNYYYQATYEWTDMQGNAFRSQPSIPVTYTTIGTGSVGTVAVSLPTLRVTSKVVSPVKVVVYRWSEATQVYNQVTSIFAPVLNDTTVDSVTFVDTLSDAAVIGNNILYTTGGVVPDTNGPASNILTLFDTRLWLVDAEDPNLLWVSKTVVEAAPVEMASEFTIYVAPNIGTTSSSGPMTALAPMDDKICLFKKNAIFYINGTGPDNLGTTAPGCPLGSYSPPTFITSVVGCTNQQSIVLTQEGLMFQSDKGIWLLNRNLGTSYVGAPVEAFNSSVVTSANVIPGTNYVLFTLNTGEMLMYDYYYGQWGVFRGVPTVSSCIYNGLHTVLDQYGRILQETPGIYLDGTSAVLMSFTTSWLNLASLQGYERFYEFYILAKYLSPHTLSVGVAYDYNPSLFHSSTITPKNFSPSDPSSFGVPVPFGSPGPLEQWRIHAKQQLCQSFQLTLQEVFDATLGTVPGAGFTMSGINCKVGVKKARRPVRGANTVG